MKKNKLLLAFVVSTLFISSPCYAVPWAKTYGGSNADYADSIQLTTDGGYIAAGHSLSFSGEGYDIWILRLNSDGAVLWEKAYEGYVNASSSSVQQSADGGFVVAGDVYICGGTHRDYLISKLDSAGNIDWQYSYGGTGGRDESTSIAVTTDGGYVAAGYTACFGAGGYDIWVLKLNSDGSVAWQKTYGGSGSEHAFSIQQTTDGGYIVGGYADSFTEGDRDFWVLKLDSEGAVTWQKTYGGSGNDYGQSIQQTTDGGYVVAGYTDSFGEGSEDLWVLKLDSDGIIEWQNIYVGGGRDRATSIQQTAGSGYIVGGYTDSYGGGFYDVCILKLDSDGTVAWQKTYGGSGREMSHSVQQTTDGGYVVAAYTTSSGEGSDDVCILRLDANGDIPNCNVMTASTFTAQGTFVVGFDTTASISEPSVSPSSKTFTSQDTSGWTWDVCDTLVADFTADVTDGVEPLTVRFEGKSTIPGTSWSWDFGDLQTSSEQNPSHEYQSAGDYTVSLTVTGPGGTDTETKVDYIHVDEQDLPVANFSANTTSGDKPLQVTFTDASTGSIDTWEWDFDNNGSTDSNLQNPTHTYEVAGVYSVKLTVTGPGGSDTQTKMDYIDVTEPSDAPIIDKIRGVKEPGKIIRIIGSGFGEPQGDSEVHIGPKVYGPGHRKIKLWTDTKIKVKLLNYKCQWFKGNDYRRRKIWVLVGGQDGVSSNVKKIKVFKPDICP